MKKVLCTLAFVILATPVFSKEQPKKTGKQVVIEYKDGTTCKAMLSKGQFVEGPIEINFYNGTTIKGDYYADNGTFYIDGAFNVEGALLVVNQSKKVIHSSFHGIFKVTNDGKRFLPKSSKIKWIVDANLQEIEIQDAEITLTGRKSIDDPNRFDFRVTTPEDKVDSLTFLFNGSTRGRYTMIEADPKSRKYKLLRNDRLYKEIIEALASKVLPTIYFHNGDVYEGRLSSYYPVKPETYAGTYKYAQGGEIYGIFDSDFAPLYGQITYGNGKIDKSEYPNKIWPVLTSSIVKKMLFEQKETLENVTQANESERLRIEKETQRREKERIAAEKKREELQIAAEKRQQELDKQRAEKAERDKEEAKRKAYVRKYGEKWGNLVYKQKFTIGMTKAMCADIVPKEWYDVSIFLGVEIWTYNPKKARLSAMFNEKDAASMMFLEAMGLMNIIDLTIPTLTFIADRLTGISE